MWMQYKADTRLLKKGSVTSTLVFWKNEHGEIDMDNLDQRDLKEFLLAMSRGHEVECDSTGEEVE